MTSGTPPAKKARTVTWNSGPLGSTSTKRGTARLIRSQSSTAGRFSPAAWAMAGTCKIKFVEPPKAAWTTMALCSACSVTNACEQMPAASSTISARAERTAMSSQTASPEGASAECGSDSPSASPTTWVVAAVPKN